jgi:translation elongation factor EF-G
MKLEVVTPEEYMGDIVGSLREMNEYMIAAIWKK